MNIAIITPIYKQTQYLPRFLASVLWQMIAGDTLHLICEEAELGAVSDALADNHCGHALAQGKIQLHINCSGISNAAAARNEGFKNVATAGCDWIKFLDADDLLAPFVFETFRRIVIPETVQCVTGPQVKVVNDSLHGVSNPEWRIIEMDNPTLPSMTFVRRSAWEKVGGFNPEIYFEEDYDFWLRLRREFGMSAFAIVNWPVCYYWIDEQERAGRREVSHQVQGMDVREYFAKTYGINPQR